MGCALWASVGALANARSNEQAKSLFTKSGSPIRCRLRGIPYIEPVAARSFTA
jgi:hypothetical protein